MSYCTLDEAYKRHYMPGEGNTLPALKTAGVTQYQEAIKELAKKFFPGALDGQSGVKDIEGVYLEAESGNIDSAAISVKHRDWGILGFMPAHTAAFYSDLLRGRGGRMNVDASIACSGEGALGVRIYGSSTDSALGTFPAHDGWEWHDNLQAGVYMGFWTKEGETPRPEERAREALQASERG